MKKKKLSTKVLKKAKGKRQSSTQTYNHPRKDFHG